MAFLYRRDLELLGYEIKLNNIKRKRLFSVVAYAELITDNQVIPCVATFFRFRNGARVDLILDRNIEYQIMKHYISFMRKSPILFMEVLARTGIKVLSSVCGIIACAYLGYILVTSSCPITLTDFSKIVDMIICIILVMITRTFLNII